MEGREEGERQRQMRFFEEGTHVRGTVHVWRSEENLLELVLSFYHVGSGNQTQAISLVASTFTH